MSFKNTIIFDLDDTLIHTSQFYYDVRAKAYEALKSYGLDTTHAVNELEEIQRKNISVYGFSKKCFPLSLAELYRVLCEKQGIPFDYYQQHKIEAIGWTIYDISHPLIDGAIEVLTELKQRNYRLLLCTKGDGQVQADKIDKSGLAPFFDGIHIVPDKNVGTYTYLCTLYNLEPSNTFMIGDSVKFDINPSMAAGLKAIHIPCKHAWILEVEPYQGVPYTITSLYQLLRLFN